jgi:superfamily II DNA or RNA helicase
MTDPGDAPPDLPRVGMLATVRNRRGIVASVEGFQSKPEGMLHLVRIEYADADGAAEETLLWERERGRSLLAPTALPLVADEPPMPHADFDALVRATRWSALTPFVAPDGSPHSPQRPIASPFFGAVQVEDFQLEPLLKALQMPRVSLLLADDVGLGKTIEAGLVLVELLLRRRARRVLVLSPASLRRQWHQEMNEKFSLSFDVVDRDETHALQSRLGLDANPWRTFPRVIASYFYLRQPDVLERFLATCRPTPGAPTSDAYHLPWDLLIVDEAHNLMPANYGEESDLTRMLRAISPYFEHKLFLTATPHNGHTRSFTGLLELLDPVRFTQKSEITEVESARIRQVVVRRLKSEINELDDKLGRPRRFAERYLDPLPLFFGRKEQPVQEAFADFRKAIKAVFKRAETAERIAGSFAVDVLGKRLLSCPATFADSWFRFKGGLLEDTEAKPAEVSAAKRSIDADIDDDSERESRGHHAARTVGAWLKPVAERLAKQIGEVDRALGVLGLTAPEDEAGTAPARKVPSEPSEDARLERLIELIEKRLRSGKAWRDDERLIVFTEYKTTLDYLERRLRGRFGEKTEALRTLYGGMEGDERDAIKRAFNDPADPVRVLLATDAAAEGLNLQETARLLLHFDVPWNPARLEQRNGRLDRHGQARDVTVFHFTSENDDDLRFLGRVIEKVNAMREDLGSLGELFDAAFQRRFEDLEPAADVQQMLDIDVAQQRGRAVVPKDRVDPKIVEEAERLVVLRRDLDLNPDGLRATLAVALGVVKAPGALEGPDARGRMSLKPPLPQEWRGLIDDTLRLPARTGAALGPLPGLVFDAAHFVSSAGGRPVFRPSKDTVLLHLGHPVFREALATFARLRFPGGAPERHATRWTVREDALPPGVQALVLLTVEEMAINELREPFHHWVRTLRIPIRKGAIGDSDPYVAPADDTRPAAPRLLAVGSPARGTAVDLWTDAATEIQETLRAHAVRLTATVTDLLVTRGREEQAEEKKRYQGRLKEVEAAMRETTLNKIRRELEDEQQKRRQLQMFGTDERALDTRIAELEEELKRRETHYRELFAYLEEDQKRVLERMLPRRYTLHGGVQVFPVAIEIRLPPGSSA